MSKFMLFLGILPALLKATSTTSANVLDNDGTISDSRRDYFEGDHLLENTLDYVVNNYPKLHMIALNGPHNGRLGGIRRADHLCYQEARENGMNGTFRAFLLSPYHNLDSLFPNPVDRSVSIVNSKDQILLYSLDYLTNGNKVFLNPANIYSFNGKNVKDDPNWPMKALWRGSADLQDKSCRSWITSSKNASGIGRSLMAGN